MSLTIKALLLFWPFFKRAVFGERTILEVVLENKHITVMFTMVIVLMVAFVLTVSELNAVRSEYNVLKAHSTVTNVCTPSDTLLARRKLFGEFLK